MSPKRRGVFSSPHFILLRDSGGGQREDDCDFANRFPLANPTREAPASSFFAIVREKGLKPRIVREREREREGGEIRDANAERHELKHWASLDLGRVCLMSGTFFAKGRVI